MADKPKTFMEEHQKIGRALREVPPVPAVLDFENRSRVDDAEPRSWTLDRKRPYEWSPTISELIKDGYLTDYAATPPPVQQLGRALRPATSFADMDISLARIKRARNAYIQKRDEAESQPGRAHARAVGVALDSAIVHLTYAIDFIEIAMKKSRLDVTGIQVRKPDETYREVP